MKPCQRCEQAAAITGEKYCRKCRKEVLQEMKDAGYLQPLPSWRRAYRTTDAQENTHETKHGKGHG